ncbi:MAG: hypothetical protein ACXVB9_14435 [Bdellovibrionota bacterium]
MRTQDTIANKIVRNINYALEAIPRALTSEKEKSVKKMKSTTKKSRKMGMKAKTKLKARTLKAKGAKFVARGLKKAKSAKKAIKAKVRKSPMRKMAKSAKVLKLKRRTYVAPTARAA